MAEYGQISSSEETPTALSGQEHCEIIGNYAGDGARKLPSSQEVFKVEKV